MGAYRPTRNIETSTKDFLTTQINANFTNVNVYSDFAEVSGNNLPAVTVTSGIPIHNRVGLGSFATSRDALLLIDVFANDAGFLKDLTDFLVGILKKSWNYNEYTVTNHVSSSTTAGKLVCKSIQSAPVNLGVNKSDLDKVDRNRSLITIVVTNGKVEA